MMDYVDIGTRSATQGRVGKAIAHMQKGNRMTLKDADKIKEAIKKIAPVLARSDDIIKVIDSVPEVVISTDTDTISRKAAIELCDWYDNPSMREDLEKLRPARFSADTISRQAALDIFDDYNVAVENGQIEAYSRDRKRLCDLPPAQPESDSGRWERHYSRPGVYADLYWHCSKCGYKTDYQYANVNHRYCPNCGRKMEREVSE